MKPTHFRIIPVKGSERVEPVPKTDAFEAMRRIIAQDENGKTTRTAYIRALRVHRNGQLFQAWVDEDGLPLGLPHNPRASAYARQHIVGTMIIEEKNDAPAQEA